MKRPRVLHVTRIHDGGAAIVLDNLVRGLEVARYEPIVVFDSCGTSTIREELSRSQIKTIDLESPRCASTLRSALSPHSRDIPRWLEVHFGSSACDAYLSLKALYQFIKKVPRVKLYVRIMRENQVDIVHTHSDLSHAKPELLAAYISGIPCVSHNHTYENLTCFDMLFSRFVDSYIYVSRDLEKYHTAQGKPPSKGIVIHNGLNIARFVGPHDTQEVRRELQIKADEVLIGLVGRLDWWKGHDYFLEAMALVSDRIRNLKGVIVGEFSRPQSKFNQIYINKIQSIIRNLGLEDTIIFTGFRKDVFRLMASFDVIVHASSSPEPFGLVVIEGMAAGKPVVATAGGGVLDIIEHGVTGMLVPCKDSKAMAGAIITILCHPDEARKMGLAARQRVAEKFTVQRQLHAVQELYDHILNDLAETPIRERSFLNEKFS